MSVMIMNPNNGMQTKVQAKKQTKGLETQQDEFKRQAQLNELCIRASFKVSKLIACSDKSISDGEFV